MPSKPSLATADASATVALIERDLTILGESAGYTNLQFSKIEPFLGSRILELGAGIGNHTALLAARRPEILVAAEQEREFCSLIEVRCGPTTRVICMDIGDLRARAEEFRRERLDTIIALNVIEHIEDDREALAAAADLLIPGGQIVLLAPAHPFLYARLDRLYGHYRRYTKALFRAHAVALDLELVEASYFNMLAAIGWLVVAKFGRARQMSRGGMRIFDRTLALQQRLEKMLPAVPFGLGILAVLRKRARSE